MKYCHRLSLSLITTEPGSEQRRLIEKLNGEQLNDKSGENFHPAYMNLLAADHAKAGTLQAMAAHHEHAMNIGMQCHGVSF